MKKTFISVRPLSPLLDCEHKKREDEEDDEEEEDGKKYVQIRLKNFEKKNRLKKERERERERHQSSSWTR